MIYPPISDLVEKAGNRYSLVILTAKRARDIAQDERSKDKDMPKQSEQSESVLKQRVIEKTRQARTVKPIIKALDEIIKGNVYFGNSEDGTSNASELNA